MCTKVPDVELTTVEALSSRSVRSDSVGVRPSLGGRTALGPNAKGRPEKLRSLVSFSTLRGLLRWPPKDWPALDKMFHYMKILIKIFVDACSYLLFPMVYLIMIDVTQPCTVLEN